MADKNWWDYPVTRGFLWSWTEWIRHSGIDYGAPCGTPIMQPTPGTVIHSGVHPWGGQIDVLVDQLPGYESGPHVMTYLHSSAQYVQEGQKVTAGTILGLSGQPPPGAGYGAGCHVHFEITHGNVAPYTTYSPSRNPSSSSYPESGASYVARLTHGHGGRQPTGANCGPTPNQADFSSPDDYVLAYTMHALCTADTGAADNCGDVPQIHSFPSESAWKTAATTWLNCFNSVHVNPINPLDPLQAIGDFITHIPHNLIRVGKIVFGFGLCAIGLVLAFLPDVGAGLVTAFGAPEFASAIRQGVSGGLGGAARGGIRAASLVPGRQRAAEKVRQRELRANVVAQRREAERSQREAIRHAPKTRPLPTVHTAPLPRPDILRARVGRVREGPHSKPLPTTQKSGRFGGLGTAPKRQKSGEEGNQTLLDIARERSKPGELTEVSETKQARRVNSMAAKRLFKNARQAIVSNRVRTARAKPSVQSQTQRAEQTKRAVARAVKRRRQGGT